MYTLNISRLNPLSFVDTNRALDPKYNLKHLDAWLTEEQLRDWETGRRMYQKWQKSDTIRMQVETDLTPMFLRIIKPDGSIVFDQQMQYISTINGMSYLEIDVPLATFDRGCYKPILYDSTELITLEGEPFRVADKWPNTLLFEYSHYLNEKGVLFETGVSFSFRVDGSLNEYEPNNTRTAYIDQRHFAQTVTGTSWRAWQLDIGNAYGVHVWQIDVLKDIFDLSDVTIDGKGFSANNEQFKVTGQKGYQHKWAALKVIESVNRTGKRFDSDGIVNRRLTMQVTVNGKLFSPIGGQPFSQDYSINEIE